MYTSELKEFFQGLFFPEDAYVVIGKLLLQSGTGYIRNYILPATCTGAVFQCQLAHGHLLMCINTLVHFATCTVYTCVEVFIYNIEGTNDLHECI